MNQTETSLNLIPKDTNKKVFIRIIKVILQYLFAGACLIWVFYDIHIGNLFHYISNINWWWIILAVVFDILSYICQGIRWKLLLYPFGRISWIRTTQFIYAGLFTNEILPMRFGELVRAYLTSRCISIDFVSIIPSMAIERLFDGIWFAMAIGITTIFFQFPKDLLEGSRILGVIVLISTIVFIYVVFYRKKTTSIKEDVVNPKLKKPLHFLLRLTENLTKGIQKTGLSKYFYLSLLVSFVVLFFQALAFWFVILAYGLKLSFLAGAVVFLIIHLGTAIPNAPSNVGTYQFFCVVGLTIFGIDKSMATSFSIVVFIILTIPLWIIGLIAINRTGMTLKSIKNEIKQITSQL